MIKIILWCITAFTFLTSCTSVPLDINKLVPDSEISGKLPFPATTMVYVAIPYVEKGSKVVTKYMAMRRILGDKLLQDTNLEIAKKYFTNVSKFSPNKKANYFIFLSGHILADPIQAVATVHGVIYNEKGEPIYDATAQSGEVTGGEFNKASFSNAMIKAQMQFYNDLFKDKLKSFIMASAKNPVLAKEMFSKIAKDKIRDISTASGFIINKNGDTLTNYHAIQNCLDVELHLNKSTTHTMVHYTNEKEDLALLTSDLKLEKHASFTSSEFSPRLGDDIVVIGFPLQGVLSSDPSLTTGNISAMAGIKNDESVFQITAPIQQGNSGGPVLNKSGAVIAMVQSKLNAVRMADYTGDIPQNVNFAIKNKVITNFLKEHHIKYSTMKKAKKLPTPVIADIGSAYTVELTCKGYIDAFNGFPRGY